MKKLITVLLLATVHYTFSQTWPVKQQVLDKLASGAIFKKTSPFKYAGNKQLEGNGYYQVLQLHPDFTGHLYQQKPEALQLTLPVSRTKNIVLELVKYSPGNVVFTADNKTTLEDIRPPLLYRGVISGEQNKHTVLLTVNEEYLALNVITGTVALQVTRANEASPGVYRLYNSENLRFPPENFSCGTDDNKTGEFFNILERNGSLNRPAAASDKCLNVFIDCFDSLFIQQGSSRQRTVNFVYELFNGVIAGYYNEQINIQISNINVWTMADPYNGTTREVLTRELADNYRDNFWGNICVGLDFTSNAKGGLADAIGKVKGNGANTCPAYTASESACCYNDLADGAIAQNFPTGPNTNNSQVYLVMHEIGHLIGSRHTKWCGWQLSPSPLTFGRIDSCGEAEPVNGCVQGPPPNNGGTIMSYCFQGTSFINYNNGFGPLPGNVIRNFVDQSACIVNCTECFGWMRKYNADGYPGAAALAIRTPGKSPAPVLPATLNNTYFISQKIKR